MGPSRLNNSKSPSLERAELGKVDPGRLALEVITSLPCILAIKVANVRKGSCCFRWGWGRSGRLWKEATLSTV